MNILAINVNALYTVWGLCITIGITGLLYYAFQRVDFSKIFKANSTFQIKTIIFFIRAHALQKARVLSLSECL